VHTGGVSGGRSATATPTAVTGTSTVHDSGVSAGATVTPAPILGTTAVHIVIGAEVLEVVEWTEPSVVLGFDPEALPWTESTAVRGTSYGP